MAGGVAGGVGTSYTFVKEVQALLNKWLGEQPQDIKVQVRLACSRRQCVGRD